MNPRAARRWSVACLAVLAVLPGCASTVAALATDGGAPDAPDVPGGHVKNHPPDTTTQGNGWTVTTVVRPLTLPCVPDSWCWEHPLPEGETIVDARTLADGSTWAVGPVGTVLRHDGTGWSRLPLDTAYTLSGVWGTRATDVWVVGSRVNAASNLLDRTLWHWNGTAWQQPALPSGLAPAAVDGTSATDLWLLSAPPTAGSTTAWHGDGTTFTPRNNGLEGAPLALDALWVESPGRVWAYGRDPGAAHAQDVYLYAADHWTHVGTMPGELAFHGSLGGAAGEVYVRASGYLGDRSQDLVQVTDSTITVGPIPGTYGGFDDTVASGNGTVWTVGAALSRRVAGAWQSVAVTQGAGAMGIRPLTVFAPDAMGGGFGFNDGGDIYQRVAPGDATLVTTAWRPRINGFVGRGPTPLAASQVVRGPVMPRNATADWAPPGTGPGGTDVRTLVVDDGGHTVFTLRGDGALVQLDAQGAPGAVVTPTGVNVTEASVNAGGAWAIADHRVFRFDGTGFVPVAALPAMVGSLDSTQVNFDHVWSEGDHAWVGGGYREHAEVPSNQGVLCDVTVTRARCAVLEGPEGVRFDGFWSQGAASTLWTVYNNALATVDRTALTVTVVPLPAPAQGMPLTLRGLRGNDRTGELVALGGNYNTSGPGMAAVQVIPSRQTVIVRPIPLSQYAAWVNGVYLGDHGELWAMSESAQIVRYAP